MASDSPNSRKSKESTGLSLFRLKQRIGEASSLAPVTSTMLLESLGTQSACWVVHDEERLESAVSLLIVRNDQFSVVPVRVSNRDRLTDAESIFVRNGVVYVMGSSFVGAKGTVDTRRAFLATFSEDAVRLSSAGAKRTATVDVSVRVFGLELTAAVNAAFQRAECRLASPSKTARKAAKKAGLPGGVPINVEGATAMLDGTTLLGFRSPVTVDGRPIILELDGDLAEGLGCVEGSTVHEVPVDADAAGPVGVRDLAVDGERIHMIVANSNAAMLADVRRRAPARHISVDRSFGGMQPVREFGSKSLVEGLARPSGSDGMRSDGWWYVVDNEKAVVVLTA